MDFFIQNAYAQGAQPQGDTTGFLIMMAGWRQFRNREVLICPTEPTRVLITDGVYRFTRNPMYLALVLIAFGIAIRLGTISALLVPPVLFVLLDRRFVRREEEFLRDQIGGAYDEYCGRVRRWV
mgnify:CR=1 FL=1